MIIVEVVYISLTYRSFEDARRYAISLKLKTSAEWSRYCKLGRLPKDIPRAPWHVYRSQWKGIGDWLGTGNVAPTNRIFRSFSEAREFVRSLKLKDHKEWKAYCKSGKKPNDIPSNPNKEYESQWKGIGDWLGTGAVATFDKDFKSFSEAREFVRSLKLKDHKEWKAYCKSGKKPNDIPSNPYDSYKAEFKGYGDWLGTGKVGVRNRKFRPFNDARLHVHSLNLKSIREWRAYCKTANKPADIPANPARNYKSDWKDWGDWLGTNTIATYNIHHRSFEDAKKFVQSLKLKTPKEWKQFCRSGKKPSDIPVDPAKHYKSDWKDWGDWLSSGYVSPQNRRYRSFEDAKKFVQSLQLGTSKEWKAYCKSGKKPNDIPAYPEYAYKETFVSYGDWLGNPAYDRNHLSFQDARDYVLKLGLRSTKEWKQFCKSGKKPPGIPANPRGVYKKYWKGMGDWIGTGAVANVNKIYRDFWEARDYARKLKLENIPEWLKFCKSGKKPDDIPTYPDSAYEEWVDWYDWLGYEDERWSPSNVKELLKSLIESRVIYDWTEARLYSLLLRKGVLHLGPNRHANFFRDLIRASRTEGGKIAVEEYAYSDSENPPDLSVFTKTITAADDEDTLVGDQEIKEAFLTELEHIQQDSDIADEQVTTPVEQILKNTGFLESISYDEEAMQFYVGYEVQELWKAAFKDESRTIDFLKILGNSGNKFKDLVVDTFLKEYRQTRQLEIPKNYSFRNKDGSLVEPFLMQLYIANKIKYEPNFGNFSGTGAGKTLSAMLASRVVDSKMTLIVSPNDVVHHWEKNAVEIFSDSIVTSGNDLFSVKYNPDKHQYLIMNYDKLNNKYSANRILELVKQRIDFVILDEIHFSKVTHEHRSIRRKNLDGLLSYARKKNPDIKILGLSATPVVNNLREGRSLLELITGKIYDDLKTNPTVENAVALYEKLTILSIRQIPEYKIAIDNQEVDVEGSRPSGKSLKLLQRNPLAIEEYLIDARIDEIIHRIAGQTIIYSEYVSSKDPTKPTIVQKIAHAVENEGYSFGFYTGDDKSGLHRFLKKNIQVLIASRPISTGVDGLQSICNNLIFNTLPWTHALYQQIIGRIVRTGQGKNKVSIHHIKASIGGFNYDQLKMNRLKFKKTLADCAVDGVLPEKNLVTPTQAMQEAIRWLERLEKGEISCITRRELDQKLTPVQIEQRIITYGDFTRLNQRINTEKSETTHKRMLKNPEEFHEYHRQYREERKRWSVVPYEYWIKRIQELSQRYVIGDFGCGEAKISQAIGSGRIISIDHVAVDPSVISCDMADVSKYVHDGDLDIALFSLSLMGKNWKDYLKESARCLNKNGYLFISETTNSLLQRLRNLRQVIQENGFEIYRDEEIGPFTFIEARKT